MKTSEKSSSYPKPWWVENQEELLKLAITHSPAYVYKVDEIRKRAKEISILKSVKRTFYAIKANSHPEILKEMYELGYSFDCVSIEELKLILSLFPQASSRILFTPNFAAISEYQFALAQNILVTVDNIYLLETFPEVFKEKPIILRLDPSQGQGHHRYTQTAGDGSKFGLPILDLHKAKAICKQYKIAIVGLHAHVGSGILDATNWARTAHFLAGYISDLPEVRFIDLGGGFGVQENYEMANLDFYQIQEHLALFQKQYQRLELWIEPGRFLVARSGILLAKMTQIKKKQDKTYIGLEVGMNALIRPALYEAYHRIENLSRLFDTNKITADIVGPICESGDFLGYKRLVAEPKHGDIFVIDACGAYGRTMASNYNNRTIPAEIFI